MAYVPGAGIAQSPEEEDKKQGWANPSSAAAPTLSGGGSATGAAPSTQGANATPPKSTPGMGMDSNRSAMQPSGSGFVNLQSFMTPTVAAQNQQRVQDRGNAFTAGARSDFGAANTKAREGVESNKVIDPAGQNLGFLTAMAGRGNTGAFDELKGMLGQKYDGPTGIDFDPSANKNTKGLMGLSSKDTALDSMHDGLRDNLQYTQGNRWLDQSMIQADQGTNDAIGKVKSGATELGTWMDAENKSVGEAAKARAGDIDKARTDTQTELRRIGGSIVDTAQKQADEANARELADMNGNVIRNEWGEVIPLAAGDKLTPWEGGSGNPTAGNFLGGQQTGMLDALGALMGDPSMSRQSTGPWQSGRYYSERDLDQAPDLRAGGKDVQLQNAGSMSGGDTQLENGNTLRQGGRYEVTPNGETIDRKTGFKYDNWWTVQGNEWVNRQTGERRPYEPTASGQQRNAGSPS